MHITATAPYVANALYYEATDFLYGIAIFIFPEFTGIFFFSQGCVKSFV